MRKLVLVTSLMVFALFIARAQNNAEQKVVSKAPTTATQDVAKPVDNPNAPVIKFDEEIHDYGTIKKGGDGGCSFTFKNTGREPLIISQAKASCGCTVPTPPKDPIMPGQTSKIDVKYNNTHIVGTFQKTITVTSNAKNSPLVLTIKGNVVDIPNEATPDKPATNPPANAPVK